MTGPYETEQQVRELPAVRAVYDAFDAAPRQGRMTPHNLAISSRRARRPGSSSARTTPACPGWPTGNRRRAR
jgi:hypothetical protein